MLIKIALRGPFYTGLRGVKKGPLNTENVLMECHLKTFCMKV
jgi:hypothetical protein